MISNICHQLTSRASSLTIRRRTKCVTDQKSSNIVAALRRADMQFTAKAAFAALPPKSVIMKRAASMKIGLPGG